jgi:nucleoside 2-deoxyribosyltransferase
MKFYFIQKYKIMSLKIYLAGPDVFLPNVKEIGEKKKDLCKRYGFEGIFPIDAELNLKELRPYDAGMAISEANEELIRNCDFVIANITPFRGPSADVGTVFEIGFAKALGKPIFAYTNTTELFTERTMKFTGIKTNTLRDTNNMSIEQWGMVDNLMIDGGVKKSKGCIISIDVPKIEMYTSLIAFEECLKQAKIFFSNNHSILDNKVEFVLCH